MHQPTRMKYGSINLVKWQIKAAVSRFLSHSNRLRRTSKSSWNNKHATPTSFCKSTFWTHCWSTDVNSTLGCLRSSQPIKSPNSCAATCTKKAICAHVAKSTTCHKSTTGSSTWQTTPFKSLARTTASSNQATNWATKISTSFWLRSAVFPSSIKSYPKLSFLLKMLLRLRGNVCTNHRKRMSKRTTMGLKCLAWTTC